VSRLQTVLRTGGAATKAQVEERMQGYILAAAQLMENTKGKCGIRNAIKRSGAAESIDIRQSSFVQLRAAFLVPELF
jgi:hypothetical protein